MKTDIQNPNIFKTILTMIIAFLVVMFVFVRVNSKPPIRCGYIVNMAYHEAHTDTTNYYVLKQVVHHPTERILFIKNDSVNYVTMLFVDSIEYDTAKLNAHVKIKETTLIKPTQTSKFIK